MRKAQKINGNSKLCSKCGMAKHLDDFCFSKSGPLERTSHCKSCLREMRTNNRDKLMLRQKEHYRRNKERFRVRQNAYDKAHADHFRELKQTEAYKAKKAEWDRADYERHKEQRKAATKEYASSHPDKYRKYRMDWKRRNPGSHLKYKAIKRGAFVEYVNVAEVYERDLGLCGICGLPVGSGEFQLDHRIPLSRGGEHSYANCQSSHALCNIKKFDRMPEDCAHLWRRS